MRLIDAEALKTDLTRFYDNEVTAKRLIDEQPIIDAIPVEWLRKWPKDLREGAYVRDILREWQKEQGARQ